MERSLIINAVFGNKFLYWNITSSKKNGKSYGTQKSCQDENHSALYAGVFFCIGPWEKTRSEMNFTKPLEQQAQKENMHSGNFSWLLALDESKFDDAFFKSTGHILHGPGSFDGW